MFEQLNDNEMILIDGGNVADKISGAIKVTVGVVAVVFIPETISKVAGGYAVLDGIADWNK